MCRKIVTFFYQWALVISSILSQSVYAQEGNTHGLYLQSKGGFLMAHRSAMAHLVRNNALGLEVGYVKYKQAYEDRFYRFPSLGFNLEFRNFGYSKVLGSAVSLSHFFGRSIYQSNSFFVDFQYGMGVGYITKKYDLATNPTNNAIGSHFNAKVTLKLMATKNFNSFTLGGGLELSHFSNGAITYPNLGLNLPSVCIQVGLLNNVRMNYHSQNWDGIDLLEKREKNLLISAVGAIKQVRANPNLPKRYPVLGVRATYQKQFSRFWSYEGSIDVLHNESNLYVYPDSGFVRLDVLQIGLYAGASYQFYKSEIIMGLGYYVRDVINPLGKLYNKIGYRYYFTDRLFGLFNVRANLGKADFFEFGIGYKVKK